MTNQPKTCNDCIHFDYSFNTNRELCMRSGVGVCTKKIELVSYDDTECEDFEEAAVNTKTSLFEQIEKAAKRVDKWPSELQIMREKSYEADDYIRKRDSGSNETAFKDTGIGEKKKTE